jgi:hypothetical protein
METGKQGWIPRALGPMPAFGAAFALLSALAPAPASAQVQALGRGSYLTERNAAVTKVPTDTWTASVTPDYKQKILSAKWWGTLMTQPFSGQMFAHPCAYKADSAGLQLAYPGAARLTGDPKIFEAPFVRDLSVGVQGLAAGAAKVARVGHWSVTARWEGGGRTLDATIMQGSPFSYYTLGGGGAILRFAGVPVIRLNRGVPNALDALSGLGGASVATVSIQGRHWALFAPTGSSWQPAEGGRALSSTLDGKGYLSVAALPDTTGPTLEYFRKYAYAFVTDTKVSWEYQESAARLITRYTPVTVAKEGTETGTLFALFPHQWMSALTPLTGHAYASARGPMKVCAGREMATAMRFNGILPVLPAAGYDPGRLNGMIAAVQPRFGDGQPYIVPTETYTAGKSLDKFGEAAQIAHIAGNFAERDRLIRGMKTLVENWFTADTGNALFYYHKPSNRLIGYPQSFFTGEKGNDHILHWAYFINAAATIAQFDPEWGKKENWGGMVEMLIRDVTSWDPADPLFEPFSYFDPYEGHCWLDGQGFEIGNNHESSSESMNYHISLIKWGMITGNKAVRDLGIYLYVNETRAIEQYWWDVDDQVFPRGYAYPTVGLVWSNGGRYYTWFSEFPYHIAGIQYIPNTAGHLYFGRRPEYVARNFKAAATEVSAYSWYDLQLQYFAYADPDSAYALFERHKVETLVSEVTESAAHTYYHLSSLKAAGRLDTLVTADAPAYAVFRKGSTRTYAAFNPDAQARKVSFSDGFSMEVPARSQIHKSAAAPPGGIRGGKAFRDGRGQGGTMRRIIAPFTRALRSLRADARTVTVSFHDLRGARIAEAAVRGGRLIDAAGTEKTLAESGEGVLFMIERN